VALAWVLRHPNVAAIPGASSVAQVEHNAAAADLELTEAELGALSGAAQRFTPVSGGAAAVRLLRERLHR
jgi:aryl-alcohol dehydrogenase-like predicted oxidoreductase